VEVRSLAAKSIAKAQIDRDLGVSHMTVYRALESRDT
jgi:DNA invertase Pin-like site-specific DNA recombinase